MAHFLSLGFGILGNIISFMVFLSPVPTFMQIYRKKSTEGFQSTPYVVSLFSACLWIYYAFVKTDCLLLITINSVGFFIESVYIIMFIIYAAKKARMFTFGILFLLNGVVFALIVLCTQFLASAGSNRVKVLGWICVGFSVSVFAAPLTVIRSVIRTKSVEFMPFWLSFFLTLSAISWFAYGLFTADKYVQYPNVLGFIFGVAQMILYIIYSKKENSTSTAVIKPTEASEVMGADGRIMVVISSIGGAAEGCNREEKKSSNCKEDDQKGKVGDEAEIKASINGEVV